MVRWEDNMLSPWKLSMLWNVTQAFGLWQIIWNDLSNGEWTWNAEVSICQVTIFPSYSKIHNICNWKSVIKLSKISVIKSYLGEWLCRRTYMKGTQKCQFGYHFPKPEVFLPPAMTVHRSADQCCFLHSVSLPFWFTVLSFSCPFRW